MIFEKNLIWTSSFDKRTLIFASAFQQVGVLAQLVEQWTENPCVPGSIPGDTTRKPGGRKTPGFSFWRGFVLGGFGDLFELGLVFVKSQRNRPDLQRWRNKSPNKQFPQ